MSINDLILKNVKCTKCNAAYGKCSCWTRCACGWSHATDEKCGNSNCKDYGGIKKPMQSIATGKLKDLGL